MFWNLPMAMQSPSHEGMPCLVNWGQCQPNSPLFGPIMTHVKKRLQLHSLYHEYCEIDNAAPHLPLHSCAVGEVHWQPVADCGTCWPIETEPVWRSGVDGTQQLGGGAKVQSKVSTSLFYGIRFRSSWYLHIVAPANHLELCQSDA